MIFLRCFWYLILHSIKWTLNWKGCGEKWTWPNLRYYAGICFEGLRKTTDNISQESQSRGWDLNAGCNEYEAGLPTSELHHLIWVDWHSGKTQHLNFRGTRSESHADCWLNLLWFSPVSLAPWISHVCLLTNHYMFIISYHLIIYFELCSWKSVIK
jgi:hypothetical protein